MDKGDAETTSLKYTLKNMRYRQDFLRVVRSRLSIIIFDIYDNIVVFLSVPTTNTYRRVYTLIHYCFNLLPSE